MMGIASMTGGDNLGIPVRWRAYILQWTTLR